VKRYFTTGLIFILLIIVSHAQDAPDLASDEAVTSGDIKVVITGLRNDKGRAQIALFASEKGFPFDASNAYMTRTADVNKGRAVTIFSDVSTGEYAISVIHDEDMDGDFDRNWLFLPGEGWGTSNDVGGFFGPGGYKDSRFILDSRSASINIIVHY